MLAIIAWISLGISFVSAVILAVDEARHPQKMWIVNIVWPATALYFRAFAIVAYFRFGRPMNKEAQRQMDKKDHQKKMIEARANPLHGSSKIRRREFRHFNHATDEGNPQLQGSYDHWPCAS